MINFLHRQYVYDFVDDLIIKNTAEVFIEPAIVPFPNEKESKLTSHIILPSP